MGDHIMDTPIHLLALLEAVGMIAVAVLIIPAFIFMLYLIDHTQHRARVHRVRMPQWIPVVRQPQYQRHLS